MYFTVSRRTDIPAFFWDWFSHRLDEGYCMVRNPKFPEKVSRYSLLPEDVDLFYFMSKNYLPALHHEHPIADVVKKFPCLFEFTITPYGRDVEPHLPDKRDLVKGLWELSSAAGRENLRWCYDPVVITNKYSVDLHKKNFGYLAELIAPYVSSARINFVNLYDHVQKNAPDIFTPTKLQKEELLQSFVSTAREHFLSLTCCPGSAFSSYGFEEKPCVSVLDTQRLSGKKISRKKKDGCLMCSQNSARDLGLYNTCPHGCTYCYATTDYTKAIETVSKNYDPKAPMLLDHLQGHEVISGGSSGR